MLRTAAKLRVIDSRFVVQRGDILNGERRIAFEQPMKLNVIVDTISTYLTLVSALLLPLLMCVWIRSYFVSERIYHAEDGLAVVASAANGELLVWAGPTFPEVNLYHHRTRQASWGWPTRRTFQRIAGRDHVWFAGFGYAHSDQFPWRSITLTGKARGAAIPMWFLALIVGVMPFRLLARNMQSSKDFLAQRAAESEAPA